MLWALAGITLLGAALRFTNLADQSFWADERFTILVLAGDGFFDVPDQVTKTEAAPVPYYLIAWLWVAFFGDGEAGLRSLSALLGTATIPVVFLAVRELSSDRAGLIAAALCACSPILVWYSQEARAFALGVLLAAVTFWLFARALDESRRLGLMAWAIASAIAIACFYLNGALVLCEAAVLLWRRRERARVMAAAALPAVTSLALLPHALDSSGRQEWIQFISFDDRIRQVFKFLLVGNGDPPSALVLAAAAVVGAALVFVFVRGDEDERRAAVIAATVGLASIAVVIAGRAFDTDYLLARNALFAWVPLGALAAIALASRRLRALGPIAALAICVTGAWLAVDVKTNERLQRAGYRPLAEAIDSRPLEGTRAVLAPDAFQSSVLLGYLKSPRTPLLGLPKADELVVAGYEAVDGDGACWWGGACAVRPAEVPASVPGFRIVERDSPGLFTMLRLRAQVPIEPRVSIGPSAAWYVQAPP